MPRKSALSAITSKHLTFGPDAVRWEPQAVFNEAAARAIPMTIDGPAVQAPATLLGEPGVVLETWLDSAAVLPLLPKKRMEVYAVIKPANTLEHCLPQEFAPLQPFVEKIADHQFSISKEAPKKVGWMFVRWQNATPERGLAADVPHLDYLGYPRRIPVSLALFFLGDFKLRELFNGRRATLKKMVNTYHTSTALPTEIQTRPLDQPIDPTGKMKNIPLYKKAEVVFEAQPELLAPAQPNQTVLTNLYTWHKAPAVPQATQRLYVNVSYFGTK